MHRIAVIATTALLAACAAPGPRSLLDPNSNAPTGITTARVALDPQDRDRVEPMYVFDNAKGALRTGELWRKVFTGTPGQSEGTLRLTSTRFDWTIIAAGFASRYTYVAEGELTAGGRTVNLKANGSSTTGFSTDSNLREAILEAAELMATQAIDTLASQKPGAALPPKSVADRLRELEQLRSEGLVSATEYEAKKKALLDAL